MICWKNCRLVVLNFRWVSSPGLHTLSREKFVSFCYRTCPGRSGKYPERVYSECVLNFATWSGSRQLREPLQATSSRSFSIFCRVILGKTCAQAGIERYRSGLVENTVPFYIPKFRKFKPDVLVEWNAHCNSFPLSRV